MQYLLYCEPELAFAARGAFPYGKRSLLGCGGGR